MKIVIHEKRRDTLGDLADKHGLIMEVHERSPRHLHLPRFYAHFKSCEIKDGKILKSVYGDGATPSDAISQYAYLISDSLLVIDAMSKADRREIYAPVLTYTPKGPTP